MHFLDRRRWMVGITACLLALVPRAAHSTRPMGELEVYRLDDLRLVSTVRRQKDWLGCFRLPDGSLRLAPLGSHIGKADGKIDKVGPGHIHLIELVSDGEGGWLERPKDLAVPASVDRAAQRACRIAKEADEAARERWAAEDKARKRQYAAANRNLKASLLGWRWTSVKAPVAQLPKHVEWKSVVQVEPYGGGFLLVTRDGNGNGVTDPWHSGIYYLASPSTPIQPVTVNDCARVEDVVVRNGRAYWLCLDRPDRWSLVTTQPDGKRAVSVLPLHASWLRLGLGESGLLVLSADTVWRQQETQWNVAFHAPTATRTDGLFEDPGSGTPVGPFLPQRSSTPFELAGQLYFPTVKYGNDGLLYRLKLESGSALEESQDFLVEHYFPEEAVSVNAAAVDRHGVLWLVGDGAVFRISGQAVRLGSARGDVSFVPLKPNRPGDAAKKGVTLPTEAAWSSDEGLYLADGKSLVNVIGGKITPLVHFKPSGEKCCDCDCTYEPRVMARFSDGSFFLAQPGQMPYLLLKRGGNYSFAVAMVSQESVQL